ncbi:MAG: hypothetical protein II975_02365 [Bacteroidales bacterium]|nr:hypothetical protein [Bacteroidales bacterium]
MKRIVSTILLLTLFAVSLCAQNCDEIVLPHVNYDRAKLEQMPKEKVQWYCDFSRNSFFVTNEVPAGSVVHDIRDVVNKRNGAHIANGFVVDLSQLSYYAYNFNEFQYQNYEKTIYFHTPGSTYKYLGLYSINETHRRVNATVKRKE